MTSAQKVELKLLEIRSLIADKEMEVVMASLDMSRGGEWRYDHAGYNAARDAEISRIIDEIKAQEPKQ